MDNFFKRLSRAFLVLGIVLIFPIAYTMTMPKHRQLTGLRAKRERILHRIEEKMHEIEEIKSKQQRFNSDREFVETLARQNRRVFPGELVFLFDD